MKVKSYRGENAQRLIRRAKIISSVASIIVIIGCLCLKNAVAAREVQSVETEAAEVQIKVPEVVEEAQMPVASYPVPLDMEFQSFVIQTCEAHHIDPAIVFAMIQKESGFDASAVGDNGASLGLMQIQSRWHSGRMEKLNCNDLLDPYQNVTVGIDFLAELLERYDGDIEKALTAYNRGHFNGAVSHYAKLVLEASEALKEGMM